MFDVVYLHGKGVVRSAFQITASRGSGVDRILSFNSFWYPGPAATPFVVLDKIHSTRFPTALNEHQVGAYIEGMRKAGYQEYRTEQMPSGVDPEDWVGMTREGQSSSRHQHVCTTQL